MRDICVFFFFNDTATTEIYTLSLHDALPISRVVDTRPRTLSSAGCSGGGLAQAAPWAPWGPDRKSTRLNSSHANISYAVFCLKKKKKTHTRASDHYYRAPTAQLISPPSLVRT